ncbi:lysosomal thioesterase PPT2-A-like [Oryzias melastigma]|uniref:lysosomal thioesterase PPT2-A-like n=1 Tax=Oryzias melastigma TaxID=30732 RepID=UPI00168D7E99|nr:lysosomal thioesterase PPT2-A-like [Oryzias melastigma]
MVKKRTEKWQVVGLVSFFLLGRPQSKNTVKIFFAEWKKNFLRIKKLVLIGGPGDDVITPWQSSHFGFYNSNEAIIEMKKQNFYRKNTFGLKTLDTRGDLIVCTQSGVKHMEWHSNQSVFEKCIQKWLD